MSVSLAQIMNTILSSAYTGKMEEQESAITTEDGIIQVCSLRAPASSTQQTHPTTSIRLESVSTSRMSEQVIMKWEMGTGRYSKSTFTHLTCLNQ